MSAGQVRAMTGNIWWRFGPHREERQLGLHAAFAEPSYPAAPSDARDTRPGVAILSRWPLQQQAIHTLPARRRTWDPVVLTARAGREDQHVVVEATQIVGAAVDGTYPSDHRAVVADLRWRG